MIKTCLDLCRDSYEKHTIVDRDVEAYFKESDGVNYLAFRGTEASGFFSENGWVDVLRDLRTIPWYDKRVGWSHAGFLKGARRIVERLTLDCANGKPLILTGHSLGGALAINAAALFHAEGFEVKKVITFGAPRTFKRRTADKWRELLNIESYSNEGDPIPCVPVDWLGWRHVNEIETTRKATGYGFKNHMLPAYFEAFEAVHD